MGKLGNIVSATKMFLNFLGNIFASWEANLVFATMFPEVGKQGNVGRKHNVSATMFPSLPRAAFPQLKENFFKMTITFGGGVSINCIYYTIFSKVLCLSFCQIPSPCQEIHMQIICENPGPGHYLC